MEYLKCWLLLMLLAMAAGGAEGDRADLGSHGSSEPKEYQALALEGNALFRKGEIWAWTGLSVGILAMVPVLYDAAFDVSIMDPAFPTIFAIGGVGLVHVGIPIMGYGSEKVEYAARRADPGFPSSVSPAWSLYRQSWKFMAGGAIVLGAMVPVVVIGAMNWKDGDDTTVENNVLTAMSLTGFGLMATGIVEQYLCWHRFARGRGKADAALRPLSGLSLQPVLRLEKQGYHGLGLRFAGTF